MKKLELSFRLFLQMIRQIAREAMLILIICAPILAGSVFRFGIPLLETAILSKFGYENVLIPFYGYFNWLLAVLCGLLFAFVGAVVVLDETDSGVTKYICVTPVGAGGYLAARIFFPAILSGFFAGIIVPAFSLARVQAGELLLMVGSTVLSGIITSLLMIAISSNKVEGMAVGKLSGLFGMILFIPMIVKGPVQYVFFIFPMFWIGKYLLNPNGAALFFALILFAGWTGFLVQKFKRRI